MEDSMKKLLLILAVVLCTAQAWAATYYMILLVAKAVTAQRQLVELMARFKTWAEGTWAAGNTYSQKGGTTYYGTITVGASGKAGNAHYHQFLRYGKGNFERCVYNKPVFVDCK